MTTTTKNKKLRRDILTKKPFYRIVPTVSTYTGSETSNIGEQKITNDKLTYEIVTQADFMRELDPDSHAINNKTIYQNWVQKDEGGLYYEAQWERHAFAFQQEILEDRLVRLTGNDIQFDLSDRVESEENRNIFYKFKSVWAEKSMERAWYEVAKSTLATGDAAFCGILDGGKFYWKVFSYIKGDELYPHYDRRTGRMNVFGRKYSDFGDDGEEHLYIDVWDDKNYYRFVDKFPEELYDSEDEYDEDADEVTMGDFKVTGYFLEEKRKHGFDRIPIAYLRKDCGPCWSASEEAIEHFELAFSRLAQSNAAFGLPILGLTKGNGKKIEELTMGDMSYAAKIFLIPADGKAEFLQRQDASGAYKSQLEELKKKIYEMSMVVKAPELKSGDTPAAAIKLLYSDSYNKAMNETQEFDMVIDDIVKIFLWGAGIETNNRLAFTNLGMSHWCIPYIPINESELVQNLALGVQNGFLSRETASERNPYSTSTEKTRIDREKQEEQQMELLLQEHKLEIQNDANVEMQEELSEIQIEQQTQIAANQAKIEEGQEKKIKKVTGKKGSVATGNGRGRPNRSGRNYTESGNWEGRENWDKWNMTH